MLIFDEIPDFIMVSVPVCGINLIVVPTGTFCCIPNGITAADGADPKAVG